MVGLRIYALLSQLSNQRTRSSPLACYIFVYLQFVIFCFFLSIKTVRYVCSIRDAIYVLDIVNLKLTNQKCVVYVRGIKTQYNTDVRLFL